MTPYGTDPFWWVAATVLTLLGCAVLQFCLTSAGTLQ